MRLVELTPRLKGVITDMWNTSALRQGYQVVAQATEMKYGAPLASLSGEVYIAYTKSNGSMDALTDLIKRHAQQQTEPQKPPETTSASPSGPLPTSQQTVSGTPERPNSSSNKPPSDLTVPNSVPEGVQAVTKTPPSSGPSGENAPPSSGPSSGSDSIFKYVQRLTGDDAVGFKSNVR